MPTSFDRLRVAALVVAAALALPAGVRAHVTDSGCETTSPTFLLCETDHARDVSCVCDGQKVAGCGGVGRLFTQTRVSLLKALRAVHANEAAKISRNLTRARTHIERARMRTAKLQSRRHVDPTCQEASAAAVESLKLWIALAFGDTTVPTTTTSTSTTKPTVPGETTSTTLAVAPSCFGDFAFYPIDMTQVTFAVWCNQAMTAFAIGVPGARTITEDVGPDGFTCGQPVPGTYRCDGALPADLWVRGRIRLVPSAVTGMGGEISGFQGDVEIGPFPMGGP